METKEEIKKHLIPPAVLVAKTNDAKQAIIDNYSEHKIVPIWRFPFSVGRESRYEMSDWGVKVFKRLLNETLPNNDLYLLDLHEYLHISREHFAIEKHGSYYMLKDRKSACGTTINGNTIFDSSIELHSGDTIQVGGTHSPYLYEFVVLD